MAVAFCGETQNATSITNNGALSNECFLDGLSFLPHILLVLISLPILIAWKKSYYGTIHVKSWVHFPGHELRWTLSLVLVLLNLAEIGEGVLSNSLYWGTHLHLFLPHLVALIGSSFTMVYYHNVELWNSPRFLLLLAAYWSVVLTTKMLKLLYQVKVGLGSGFMRFNLNGASIVVCSCFLLIEIYVLLKLRYALFVRQRKLHPPSELAETSYIHDYVSLPSRVTFYWVTRLLVAGYRNTLERKDLGDLPPSESAVINFRILHSIYEEEKVTSKAAGRGVSLWRCYLRAFWRPLVAAGFCKLLGDMLAFLGPLCISRIIHYVEETSASAGPPTASLKPLPREEHYVDVSTYVNHGYFLCTLLFVATIAQNSALQVHHHLVIRQGIRLRAALQVLIYRKSLHLSSSEAVSAGTSANLISVDVYNVMMFFYMGHYLWALPVKVTLVLVYLYHELGLSALIAAGILLTLCPLQYALAKMFARIQKQTMVASDERLRLVTELLTAIKLVKLCAWERLLAGRVEAARSRQLHLLLKGSCLAALTGFLTHGTPVLITLVAFVLFPVLQQDGESLTASHAFVSLALFNMLAVPLHIFPMVVNVGVNAVISSHRIAAFLCVPEVGAVTPMPHHPTAGGGATSAAQEVQVEISLQTSDGEFLSIGGQSKRGVSIAEVMSHHSPGKRQTPKPQLCREDPEFTAIQEDSRKHSTVSCSHYEEVTHGNMLAQADRKRPRSVGNLLTVHLYEETPHTKVNQDSEKRKRAMSGSHMTKPTPMCSLVSITSPTRRALSGLSGDPLNAVSRPLVDISDGCFSWDLEGGVVHLDDVNIKLSTGVLTMIVGPVGAGKTSLLSVLLGEMRCLKGTVTWHCFVSKAYAGQTPWLLNDSLQNNILFGRPMVKKRYRRVLTACALKPDISILPAGDQTEIGEKGINLSGGQKHRVSLARAIYSHADVVILDDPFSALDVHVGSHIFETGILRMLLKRHCSVIMVTHQLQYLKHAQTILTFSDGTLSQVDNLDALKVSHPDLYDAHQRSVSTDRFDVDSDEAEILKERRYLQHHMSTREFQRHLSTSQLDITVQNRSRTNSLISNSPLYTVESFPAHDESVQPADHVTERRVSHARPSHLETPSTSCHTTLEKGDPEASHKLVEAGRLIEEEERPEGAVSGAVYWAYVQACSVPLVGLVVGLHLAISSSHVATDFWLADWSSADSGNASRLNGTHASREAEVAGYIRGYTGLALTTVFLSLLVAVACELVGLLAASRLHQNMLTTIISAPMRFFDVTPIGRIINRFAGDTFIIDDKLPAVIKGLMRTLLLCLSAILINAVASPYFLLIGAPIIIIYFFLQRFYRASSRELARLDSITKSPIMAHFTETLGGLSTIRAYRDTERFQKGALCLIDTNTTIFLWLNTCNRWLGVRLDHLGALVVFAAALSTTTSASHGYISSGFVGLGITYALMVAHYLNWVIRFMADTEMQMNAVERVVHYGQLDGEGFGRGEVSVPQAWPEEGHIQFDSVSLRYASTLKPAVSDVTLTIKAGTKVGVCGRTGSGKSSLALGLFRLNDLVEGRILIDGVDISHVTLETLRARLSIIPQDPVLFSGTIRFNLDPYGRRCDNDLWQALKVAQLGPTIEQLAGKLDADVQEGGSNFSVGQRQLFCLARAFLRNSRILVMDEATASIDMETDHLIQQVLSRHFKEKTVLIIAHRVSTITNCDTIIVLDSGKVIENDTPEKLMANEEGVYYSLIKGNK